MTNAIQSGSVYPTTTSTPSTPSASMGKDDFLKMLVMQLRYQDPMNPLNGTEFAAQLAQFSSVEQLTNINDQLKASLAADSSMTASINNALATTFIGKGVRATTDTFQYGGSGDVKIGYTLPQQASAVTVKVYDGQGNLVRTMANTAGSSGDNVLTWDGKDDSGLTLGTGTYKFTVEAKDAQGADIQSSPFIEGTVSGVRFKSSGTVFVIDGVEVSIANVLEIMQE